MDFLVDEKGFNIDRVKNGAKRLEADLKSTQGMPSITSIYSMPLTLYTRLSYYGGEEEKGGNKRLQREKEQRENRKK